MCLINAVHIKVVNRPFIACFPLLANRVRSVATCNVSSIVANYAALPGIESRWQSAPSARAQLTWNPPIAVRWFSRLSCGSCYFVAALCRKASNPRGGRAAIGKHCAMVSLAGRGHDHRCLPHYVVGRGATALATVLRSAYAGFSLSP